MQQDELFSGRDEGASHSYYYSTPGRYGLLQQVIHFLRFGEGVPVVQGGGGSGRTTLSKQLVVLMEPEASVVRVAAGAYTDFATLLGDVSKGFGLPGGASGVAGESLVGLRHFARALSEDKKLAVLVVDDAGALDDQALGGLMSLMQGQQSGGGGFLLVLFSDPGLVARVDELGLLDVPVYDFDVPAFSPSELGGFLKGVAGDVLPSDVVQSVWSGSQGYPGAALLLLEARGKVDELSVADKKSSFTGLPLGHLFATGVLAVVLIWAFVARQSGDNESPVELSAEFPVGHKSAEQGSELAEKVAVVVEGDSEAVVDAIDGKEVEEVSELPAFKPDFIGREESVEQEVTAIEGVDVKQSIQVEMEAELADLGAPEGEIDAVIEPRDLAPVLKPVEAEVEVSAPDRNELVDKLGEYERFLLAQKESAYTLQVLAASQKEALMHFVNRQPNRSSLRIYQGMREGKRLYVVVAGVYSSRKVAVDAIADLPLTQRQAGPWPRQLKSIQTDIRENRRN